MAAKTQSQISADRIRSKINYLRTSTPTLPKIICHNSAVSSKFRIAASRANGAKFRGRVTDEGKRIAALNTTHLARTFRTLADQSQVLHFLNRYETRFSREYPRALACATAQRTLREQRERQQARRNRNRPAPTGEIP